MILLFKRFFDNFITQLVKCVINENRHKFFEE